MPLGIIIILITSFKSVPKFPTDDSSLVNNFYSLLTSVNCFQCIYLLHCKLPTFAGCEFVFNSL